MLGPKPQGQKRKSKMETTNNTPVESTVVPTPASPATAPVAAPVVKGELPKTTKSTVGGWNRFAGYNPNDAKNKKNDRGDRNKGRR
jgi:hypothetical protein